MVGNNQHFRTGALKVGNAADFGAKQKPSRLCTSERVSASGSSAQIYTETAAQANAAARKSCGRVKPRERKTTAKTADSTMPSALKMLLPAMTVPHSLRRAALHKGVERNDIHAAPESQREQVKAQTEGMRPRKKIRQRKLFPPGSG